MMKVQTLGVFLLIVQSAIGYGLNQKTLVVSFDGFRQIYLDGRFLPWFSTFKSQGVYSSNAQAVFPSETFPNHWSIVTGMYTESHGIVGNSMYDPKLDEYFSMDNLDPLWWGQAEPVWVTARKQGKVTAVSFWPGSAVVFEGQYTPDFYRPKYDNSVPFENRIDEIVEHLSKDDADLAFLYFNQPDNDGHHSGTSHDDTQTTLQLLDWYLSYLLVSLDGKGLGQDKLNIILCADHGMTTINERLNLQDYIDIDDVDKIPSYGATMLLEPKSGKLDTIYEGLSAGAKKTGKFDVYKRSQVPEKYHFSSNDRIQDIVVVCKLGYFMAKSYSTGGNAATHGYDPAERHMQPMFMAKGPAFKSGGYKGKSFTTKDIYAIITHTAGIDPPPNNSSMSDVLDLFA